MCDAKIILFAKRAFLGLALLLAAALPAAASAPRSPWLEAMLYPSLQVPREAAPGELPAYLKLPAVVSQARTQLWWTSRHIAKSAEAREGKADFIMIGDSLVHHFELRGLPLWNLYFGRYHPLNLGFSGDTTENVLWRLQHGELDGLSPRLAVIMIGTNNAGLRRDAPQFTTAGIRALLDTLRSRLPQTRILLLGVFPRGPTPRNRLRILNQQVNQLLPALADGKCIRFLDIGGQFLDAKGILRRDIMFDFLHPTVKGYQIWAEAIGPTVLELMAPGPPDPCRNAG